MITRDPRDPVQYREQPGTDATTGRQCRPVTPELVERLREYEKGNRPKRIETAEPTFFDLRTGEPVIWYNRDKNGDVQLFDLMGFDPETGDELLPIRKEVVALWKEQSKRQAPRRIDPQAHNIFDPLTGEPRVWFWRKEGEYEFYDNPGFHPRTGEPLSQLTKEAARTTAKEAETRQARLEDEKRKRDEEERKRLQRADEDRKREDAERRDRELRRERETRAGQLCDQLAANPTDANRVGEGVTYSALREQAPQAIEQCSLASGLAPTELRFRYQLARALQRTEPDRALIMFSDLAAKRYPAAFDNAGWLLITRRKNYAEAIRKFQTGAQLGNADCMASLVEMYDRGLAVPRHQREGRLVLLEQAARFGHAGAIEDLRKEQERMTVMERERTLQMQQSQQMMRFFGTVLGAIPRH